MTAPHPTPSPADPVSPRPVGGEAAAGPGPSRSPAAVHDPARLIPTPFGLEAHGGNSGLSVFTRDGARVLRLAVNGQAVDLLCGDDARDALAALMAATPR